MGFLKPKIPDPIPPPNPASTPVSPEVLSNNSGGLAPASASLISTSVSGLKRRASTQRTSLIGGA